MGNVFLWTYSVILLCLCGITFSQRFPYENPSSGYRNAPSKLNLRNFLGSKLIERLADNQNNDPQYERYPHQMSNPLPYEQMAHPPPPPPPPQPMPPPPPLPPSYARGVVPYEFQNQRIPVPPPPPPIGSPRHLMSPPPSHVMDPPPPNAMDQPPHHVGPPPQHVSQSNMQENVYTETITSSCPECEAANQDYSYQEEPCSCPDGGCPCSCPDGGCPCSCPDGGSPCSCEDCPCCCKNRGRCPCCPEEPAYPSEKDYPDRDQNYDDYPTSDCPCCCCDSEGNHECSPPYPDEPQGPPQYRRERPSQRGYPPVKQVNENYMEGSDSQVQRESYHSMVTTSSYKPVPPPREVLQRRYQQYDEPMEPPQYVRMPPRRGFVPQPDMPPPPVHHPPIPELPEEPMHRHHMQEPVGRGMQHPHIPPVHHPPIPELPEEPMHRHHMQEPVGRGMQHPGMQHMPEMSDRTMHHTEINERAMHRSHEAAPPMPAPHVDSYSMHQPGPRVSSWRAHRRMPPPGPPRHMMEEENLHPEPPVPMYRKSSSKRYSRKYRQPPKLPFFEGLSHTDGC